MKNTTAFVHVVEWMTSVFGAIAARVTWGMLPAVSKQSRFDTSCYDTNNSVEE